MPVVGSPLGDARRPGSQEVILTGHTYDLQRLWNHGGHLVRHASISGATDAPLRRRVTANIWPAATILA